MRGWIAGLWVIASAGSTGLAADEVPSAFAPFEHMIGGWKGTASPSANKVKGWPESHGWAWKFEKGKPTGLTLTLEGDKTLAKGSLGFDPASKKYKLDGTDPAGKPVAFLGSISPDGKILTLDRVGTGPEGGKERIVVRPNANKIRYTMQVDRQEPGAPQYKNVITVGLTKDGESFAAGSGGADLPKCIMTGGAAGITVTYQGKSYPVCCTGCRVEFNDNPEKYAKIADAAARSGGEKGKSSASKDKPAAKGKDDGSFDGLIDEPRKGEKDEATRAVEVGKDFEKDGKKDKALAQFRKVVKDHPDTEAAKTAAARIKALEGK